MLRPFQQSASPKQQKDSGAESDYSMEFNSGFGDPSASGNIIETSGPLWGPNIRVQQTPALTSQRLELWRNYGESPQSIQAAAELDKLYASLPDDKLDLTLTDLVEGPKGSSRVKPAKDGYSMTIGAILGRKPKDVKKGAAKEDGGKFKPKNKVHNSPSISLPFKLPTLSPKRDKSSAAVPSASPERPTFSSHSRAQENGSAPRKFGGGYSVDGDTGAHSPAGLQYRESDGSTYPLTLRQQLLQTSDGSRSPNVRHSGLPPHDCSICSASNLIFKTRCTVCGKNYCYRCVKEGMGNMPDGRKCKKTCVGRPSNPRFTKKAGVGCWPLFGFSNNHASVAEATARMTGDWQDASRHQEIDVQRRMKASSYPPSGSRTPPLSPRRNPAGTSPRQSTRAVYSRPVNQHSSHHSLPSSPMTVS